MIFILTLGITCCSVTFPLTKLAGKTTSIPPLPATPTALPLPSTTPNPSVTPRLPSATPTPLSSQTTTPPPSQFTVYYHPDDVLYVGDQVSFEVVSPPGVELKDASLQVHIDPPSGQLLDPVKFAPWGIQGREEAVMLWAWDTSAATPGEHTLAFSVQPQGYQWTEQVVLLPSSEMPPDQASAGWASTQSQCCTVFYITNTASERDLSTLVSMIDQQASLSVDAMDTGFTEPITITLLPRLLGHGGFASSEISVSYLDRNYAANEWQMVVRHEMIHDIDAYLGGSFRPSIFVEGLAVYMAGGHYKPEPLMPRAAALQPDYLNWYIPLKALSDDFYASQHEIGYLEGASLIEYMVETYGWEAFSNFYRNITINEGESQSQAIDTALKLHFSTSFDQLEQDYLAALSQEPDTLAWVDDVRLTVNYFDSLRRYQQLLDPSAYFRTAWLLDNQTMRDRGIVADYLRHPRTPTNLALETLFITTNRQMTAGQFSDASQTLDDINAVLDAMEQGTHDPFSASPIAADYFAISSALLEEGYEVQHLILDGDSATASVTTPAGPDLLELQLSRSGGAWSLSP